MGRRRDARDPVLVGGAQDLDARGSIARPVVDPRQDVRVKIDQGCADLRPLRRP